ncbi:MAG TPA: ATP-binding protein [Caulobacteraceae bacterium]|nr:ATP-binding protein [Caulobacteraceae bacterium]
MAVVRPTFSVGHVVPGFPAIRRVIRAEPLHEVYELDDEPQSVLLLVRRAFEFDDNLLERWLSSQHPRMVTRVQGVPEPLVPTDRFAVAIQLAGRCLDRTDLADAAEARLAGLFDAMLQVAERTAGLGLHPNFAPGLVWEADDMRALSVLMPLGAAVTSEAERVQSLARSFYRWAGGVDLNLTAGPPPPLRSWSKFAGEGLSRIVTRCIAPATPREAITSFAGLSLALAHLGADTSDVSPSSTDELRGSLPPDAGGNGLAKVAGMHELKDLLAREVVEPLRNPEPYRRYGLTIPNGILLYGPPGCGKTYIARQLAEELGHHFIEVIPSELASPFVHQTVIQIREAFDEAAERAPSVIFIDEFEALAPAREGLGGHQHHKAEEVNEFLAHLNNCSERGVFVVAATNQPDRIDAAVKRTGRLDKLIYVGPPDLEARCEMLALHLSGRPVSATLDLGSLANALTGYSASDIRFLVDEAARDAFRDRREIDDEAFAGALARIAPSVPPEIEGRFRSFEQRGI